MTHWCWPQFVMTHGICSTCSTLPQIRKDGTLQTLPVVAIKRLKDLPTWLKVATTLEKAPTPTHLIIEICYKIFNLFCAPHLIICRQNIQYVHKKKNWLLHLSEWLSLTAFFRHQVPYKLCGHHLHTGIISFPHIGNIPDSRVHGANMGPIWGRQDPGGPHVGPINIAIWDAFYSSRQ